MSVGGWVAVCVCLCACGCGLVGYHDNSKYDPHQTGSVVKVVTISSWLNFGHPAPPGRGPAKIFWLRLTTASAQCLRLWAFFSFSLTKQWNAIIADKAFRILDSVKRLKSRLSDIIESDFGLLDQLLRLGVLTRRQVADIRSERTVYRRNDALLDLLTSEEQCDQFLTALRCTHQQHIINLILQQGGHDFDPCMQFAKVCLFADDAKLYKHVTSREDHQSLQNGLNALQEWSNRWLLKLNISKCKTVFMAEILTTNITIISHRLS